MGLCLGRYIWKCVYIYKHGKKERKLTRKSEATAGAVGTRRPLLRVARLLLSPSGILAYIYIYIYVNL